MTNDELKEIEERANAATPGPWEATITGGHYQSRVCELMSRNVHAHDDIKVDFEDDQKNGDFIAHARTDIPALIQAIRERDARIEKLVEALDGVHSILVCAAISSPDHIFDICETAFKRAEKALEGEQKR